MANNPRYRSQLLQFVITIGSLMAAVLALAAQKPGFNDLVGPTTLYFVMLALSSIGAFALLNATNLSGKAAKLTFHALLAFLSAAFADLIALTSSAAFLYLYSPLPVGLLEVLVLFLSVLLVVLSFTYPEIREAKTQSSLPISTN